MSLLYKVLLVDDEENSLSVSELMITKHCPNFVITGKANTVDQAIILIKEHQPDVVLLDIELSNESGFDLLQKCPPIDYEVVFLTAHSHFALRALKASAVDFLEKPLIALDLIKAFNLVIEKRTLKNAHKRYELLLQNLTQTQQTGLSISKIPVAKIDGYIFVDIEDIVSVEANGEYCYIRLLNNERHLVTKSFGALEEELSKTSFFKPHRSHLINLNNIKKLITKDGCWLIMETNDKIPVARKRKNELLQLLNL